MVPKWSALILAGLLPFLIPEVAMGGTMAMAPGQWAAPLADGELQGIRGGYFGLAFSVSFEGIIDKGGNAPGIITKTTGTGSQPSLEFKVTDGETSVRTVIGDFNGAKGIFQINQVPGNYNIVHNNLFLDITLVTVQNAASIPGLMSSMGGPVR